MPQAGEHLAEAHEGCGDFAAGHNEAHRHYNQYQAEEVAGGQCLIEHGDTYHHGSDRLKSAKDSRRRRTDILNGLCSADK